MVTLKANSLVIKKKQKDLYEFGIELTKEQVQRRATMLKLKRNIRKHLNVSVETVVNELSSSPALAEHVKKYAQQKKEAIKAQCGSCLRNNCITRTTIIWNECYFDEDLYIKIVRGTNRNCCHFTLDN